MIGSVYIIILKRKYQVQFVAMPEITQQDSIVS